MNYVYDANYSVLISYCRKILESPLRQKKTLLDVLNSVILFQGLSIYISLLILHKKN